MPLPRILKVGDRVYCSAYTIFIVSTPLTNGRVVEVVMESNGESVAEVMFDSGLCSEFRCVDGGLYTDLEGNILLYENPYWDTKINVVSKCVVFVKELIRKLLFWVSFKKGA